MVVWHRLCALLSKLVNVAAPTSRSSAYRNGRLAGRGDGLKGFFASQPLPLKPPTPLPSAPCPPSSHHCIWPPPPAQPLHLIRIWNQDGRNSQNIRTAPSMLISKANPLARNITSQQTELTMENFVTQYRNSPTDSTYHSLGIIFIWWLWRQFWKTNQAAISKDWVSFGALVGYLKGKNRTVIQGGVRAMLVLHPKKYCIFMF